MLSVTKVRNLERVILLGMLCVGPVVAQPETSGASEAFDDCMLEFAKSARDDVTLGELRENCKAAAEAVESAATGEPANIHESALERRLAIEGATSIVPFTLTPHRPNYLIAAYNFNGFSERVFERQFDQKVNFQNPEVKFQISYKFALARNLFNDRGAVFAAYTNRSFWQVFDDEDSRPFRETNHEPEAWLALNTDWDFLGLHSSLINVGISHQSNGQGGLLSRSWNRIYASFVFERNNFYFGIKPWYRIPESREDDDNPDIEDYLGHFEFQGIYKHNKQTYGLFFRNNLQSDNRGAIRLDWSTPVRENVRGYVQWFYGYGESLIDYDNKVHSLGVGIQLSDWL